MKITLDDETFGKMMDELRNGRNEFVFTNENKYFEERFLLVRDGKNQAIRCVELDKIYSSIKEASEDTKCQQSNLSLALKTHGRCNGLTFEKYFGVVGIREWRDYNNG